MDKFEPWNFSRSLKNALAGIKLIFKNEINFRIELVAALLAIIFGFLFKISYYEWIAISLVMSLVFISEAINSSIEALADIMSKDFKVNIKYAKDVSSGGVLISTVVSLVTGLIVFLPYIIDFIKNILS